MDQVIYCVLFHCGDWQIFSNGVHYGPHRTPEAAIKFAVGAAKRAQKDGQPALVLLQNRDGGMQTIWKYGNERAFSYAC
jgi:hypothetical protein